MKTSANIHIQIRVFWCFLKLYDHHRHIGYFRNEEFGTYSCVTLGKLFNLGKFLLISAK